MSDSWLDRLQRKWWARRPRSALIRGPWWVGGYALALLRDVVQGEVTLHATSLVYTTLLSFIPLLALAFSLLKALGVHHGLDALLENLLQPLGAGGGELAQRVVGFVDNVKVGVLGALGVIFLLYSAISLIYKTETSFNRLWEVGGRNRLLQRFGEYVAVLVVAPAVAFAVFSVTASLRNQHVVAWILRSGPLGDPLLWLSKVVTYLLMAAVFIFLYGFMPNARVRLRTALVGGLLTGIVWQTASVGFSNYVARASQYNIIYSGFAIFLFLLLWLYISWLIVLLGCRLTFYLQYPRRLLPPVAVGPGSRAWEGLALNACALVVRRYLAGEPPMDASQLAVELDVKAAAIERALAPLVAAEVLVCVAPRRQFVPARDPAGLSVAELWRSARGAQPPVAAAGPAEAFIREVEAHLPTAPNLRDWATAGGESPNDPARAEGVPTD
ncbi:MAG TPA: YihY/virulence factor BrkB family protein [Nevskiaceae bacterium]